MCAGKKGEVETSPDCPSICANGITIRWISKSIVSMHTIADNRLACRGCFFVNRRISCYDTIPLC